MKFSATAAILLFTYVAINSVQGQRRYVRPLPVVRYPPVAPQGDRYAASLGGAAVGTYGRIKTYGGNRNGWVYQTDEVFGESLGNAKVGIYGNDRTDNRNWPV